MSRPGYATSTALAERRSRDRRGRDAGARPLGASSATPTGWSGGGPHALAWRLRCRTGSTPSRSSRASAVRRAAGHPRLAGRHRRGTASTSSVLVDGEVPCPATSRPRRRRCSMRPGEIVDAMACCPDVDGNKRLGTRRAAFRRRSRCRRRRATRLAFVETWRRPGLIAVPSRSAGRADLMVPCAPASGWRRPCRCTRPAAHGDGHLSIVVGRADEIVEDLLSCRLAPVPTVAGRGRAAMARASPYAGGRRLGRRLGPARAPGPRPTGCARRCSARSSRGWARWPGRGCSTCTPGPAPLGLEALQPRRRARAARRARPASGRRRAARTSRPWVCPAAVAVLAADVDAARVAVPPPAGAAAVRPGARRPALRPPRPHLDDVIAGARRSTAGSPTARSCSSSGRGARRRVPLAGGLRRPARPGYGDTVRRGRALVRS